MILSKGGSEMPRLSTSLCTRGRSMPGGVRKGQGHEDYKGGRGGKLSFPYRRETNRKRKSRVGNETNWGGGSFKSTLNGDWGKRMNLTIPVQAEKRRRLRGARKERNRGIDRIPRA